MQPGSHRGRGGRQDAAAARLKADLEQELVEVSDQYIRDFRIREVRLDVLAEKRVQAQIG